MTVRTEVLTDHFHRLSLSWQNQRIPPPPLPPHVPRSVWMDELDAMGLVPPDQWEQVRCADVLRKYRNDVVAAAFELAGGVPGENLVELDILVGGQPLRKVWAAAECCRAQLCSRTLDDFGRESRPHHKWEYAVIPCGSESAQFAVRLRNNTRCQLAVELIVDNDVQSRRWNVPPRAVRMKSGRGTRDFKS